jgi:hypothetical protein
MERFVKRWQRFDHALTSQHILRNRYNDSLHRYTIHQIVERFTKRWQRSDHALISQHILRNRYNDSLIVGRFTKSLNALQSIGNALTIL